MEMIGIEQFVAVRMVVGRIVSAEQMDGSDKMLKLLVDTGGPNNRTILSGIAQHYTATSLVGRKCVVVVNLQPKEIMGVGSNGMVVCASYTDGLGAESVRLVEPALGIPVGSPLS
ncbi:MAG: methionine--tRNA ligase subunit beta [Candidatus Kaiserbacteria bacterium]|nr:methionine--tRNA ligase subunit beta [Candidatus Kaiserbacteria bacterium]